MNEIKAVIAEYPGEISRMKASQIVRLIEAYCVAHPEVLNEMPKNGPSKEEPNVKK